ncbi:hypothetical protein R3P38DRAFT_3178882 [Favolaschia claudopus]|uniref:DUF4387 domain-containing protein n=1 Tax=Favolaschia claudopus TaxID=2862362 RepID=A0AAW0CUC1_9AGAR
MANEIKIFTPIGMLGYGYDQKLFWDAVNGGVDAIIVDAGSTDSGPSKLAVGSLTVKRSAYVKDLGPFLAACHYHRTPILIGSTGGDGANSRLPEFLEIISEIVSKNGYRSMKVLTIESEIDKSLAYAGLERGTITPCGGAVPALQKADIDAASRLVAQMGHEPYVKAMQAHPDFDIIIGGRSYDPAPYAAFCIYKGIQDYGIAYHMGKIMECGALCATPKSREALAVVRADSFDLSPLSPAARCTKVSVAGHTLYEKSRPDLLTGPGGELDLIASTYEELPDGRTVRCRGAVFRPTPYTIKLEGAKVNGYQTTFMGGVSDPILISQIDDFLEKGRAFLQETFDFPCDLKFHVYGRTNGPPFAKEIGVGGVTWAETQEQANIVASTARVYLLHAAYPAQLSTGGNLSIPIMPFGQPLGPLCEFCVYHLLPIDDPTALFPIKAHTIEGPDTVGSTPPALSDSAKGDALSKPLQAKVDPSIAAEIVKAALQPPPKPGFVYLASLASMVRSKNSGPYDVTMDVMFQTREAYDAVKKAGILTREKVREVYRVNDEDVLVCMWWEPALAWKATLKREKASGSFGESDMYACQMHVPLMYLEVPEGL